jgi:hypothetical protein
MRTIKVQSGLGKNPDGGFKLAIFERHSAHKELRRTETGNDGKEYDVVEQEEGQLYIADDKVHEVAYTGGVRLAINEGRLKEVEDDEFDEELIDRPAGGLGQVRNEPGTLTEEFGFESDFDPDVEDDAPDGEETDDGAGESLADEDVMLKEGDTIDSLKTRYKHADLLRLASKEGKTDVKDDWTKEEIAREILGQ